MKKIGIICEYNPFHNGHLYHIEKIKELYPDSCIVLVMSGNFTQRGEASILNKWDKTDLALRYGVDLVIEIPFVFATQSADVFARASIELLTELKVDTLVFGSETNNIDILMELAHIQLKSKKYNALIQNYLEEGINYPTALSKALFTLTSRKIDKPNDILGLAYIREIIRMNSPIKPVCIKRNNDYNSKELNSNITSATSIRYALSLKEDVENYVPSYTNQLLLERNLVFTENYFSLLKYKLLTEQDLSIYQTVDEGIENRLLKNIITSKNMEEFLLKIKTKRYTHSKLNRMFLHILCCFTKEEALKFKKCTYIRVLGFNMKGQNHLNEIKNDVNLPIVVKFASIQDPLLKLEFRSTCVYASILEEKEKQKIIEAEYKMGPIIR